MQTVGTILLPVKLHSWARACLAAQGGRSKVSTTQPLGCQAAGYSGPPAGLSGSPPPRQADAAVLEVSSVSWRRTGSHWLPPACLGRRFGAGYQAELVQHQQIVAGGGVLNELAALDAVDVYLGSPSKDRPVGGMARRTMCRTAIPESSTPWSCG